MKTKAANSLEQLPKSLTKDLFVRHSAVFLGLISGFSVFYFLYFFGSYGIHKGLSYSGHSHLFRSLSFGFLTFIYLTILEKWLKPKLKIAGFKRALIWYIALVVLGSQLIFLLFNYFWNWQELSLISYALIQKEFPLMMVLPLMIYLAVTKLGSEPNNREGFLAFQSENGKDQLKIRLQDFLYATSSGNYITIAYVSEQGSKQHLIRKPLKVLEQELETYPEIVRSQRSYLVNRTNVKLVKQTKGKILLEIGEVSIPVSKHFQNEFL